MKFEYKTGDLLAVPSGHIVHGCNAQGAMGAGVALAIRNKWPDVFRLYADTHRTNGLHLGDVLPVGVSPKLVVWNAITQEFFGPPGQRYLSYDAVADCFLKISEGIQQYGDVEQHLHIPTIGARLAGGDWASISAIIRSVVKCPVTVWVLQQ